MILLKNIKIWDNSYFCRGWISERKKGWEKGREMKWGFRDIKCSTKILWRNIKRLLIKLGSGYINVHYRKRGMRLGCLAWSQRLSEILQAAGYASSSWNVILESGRLPVTTLYSTKGISSDNS